MVQCSLNTNITFLGVRNSAIKQTQDMGHITDTSAWMGVWTYVLGGPSQGPLQQHCSTRDGGNMLTLWLSGLVSGYLTSGRFGVHFWRRCDAGFLFQCRGHQLIHVMILSRTPSLTTRRHGPVIKTFCRVLSRVVVSSRRHDDCPDSFDQRASSVYYSSAPVG